MMSAPIRIRKVAGRWYVWNTYSYNGFASAEFTTFEAAIKHAHRAWPWWL